MRGFCGIGLFRPKTPENVGGALRAAQAYGAAFVSIEGARNDALRHGTNTGKAHRHVPVYMVDDLIAHRPHDTQLVVVDLIEGAEPLPTFRHPERALYVFGPEDGTLGHRHTSIAQHVVYVPTTICMNLAATVNVILYDRLAKGRGSSVVERLTENQGVGGSTPPLGTIGRVA